MAGRGGIEALLYLLDEAVGGRRIEDTDESQALLPITAMITHHAHHAGEIDHIRSLLHADDRWRHVQLGFG